MTHRTCLPPPPPVTDPQLHGSSQPAHDGKALAFVKENRLTAHCTGPKDHLSAAGFLDSSEPLSSLWESLLSLRLKYL